METELLKFIDKIKTGEIDLYNEFGIQFELALYLRGLSQFYGYKIELERPIRYFGIAKTSDIPKKEIDLCAYNIDTKIKYAVEIKYSNNGQVPLQMFKFCEDICFLEHLKSNGFTECYSLVIVGDESFCKKKIKNNGIYGFFRGDKIIHGSIVCPTGKDMGREINIYQSYKPEWIKITERVYCYLLTI